MGRFYSVDLRGRVVRDIEAECHGDRQPGSVVWKLMQLKAATGDFRCADRGKLWCSVPNCDLSNQCKPQTSSFNQASLDYPLDRC